MQASVNRSVAINEGTALSMSCAWEVNVACDTCMKDNMVLATGEITTSGRIGPETVARKC